MEKQYPESTITELTNIIFYYKDDCHLCEQMEHKLADFIQRYRARVKVEKRDIEACDAWWVEFREYIPVIIVGDQEICHYFFDEAELRAALGI